MINFKLVLLAAISGLALATQAEQAEQAPIAPLNLVLGTQAIGGRYQFTDQDALVESAEVIRDLGASVFKFALRLPPRHPTIHTVTDLVREDAAYQAVLRMPFRDYLMWVNAQEEGAWARGLKPEQVLREYRQMYDLTAYLLRTFSGSGKSFYLGHWEGDNMLRPGGIGREGDTAMADATRVQGFIDWLKIRQQAVDDAKRDIPHDRVQVWHYTEVNHPTISLLEDRPSIANRVLPKVPVDFVSYSSYDSQADPALLRRTLDYLQAQLQPKPGLPERRVFIGEYGFPTRKDGQVQNTPAQQNQRSLAVIQTGLEWGCPFILYWQLFNNELDPDGSHRGFWMIDERGAKQPIYETYRAYYAWAKEWTVTKATTPSQQRDDIAFRAAAVEFAKQRSGVSSP